MSWKAIDALDDARDATASLLLPFDAGRWARLALIALFVGGLGGSGGAGSNTGTTTSTGGGSTDIPIDSLPGFVTPENVIAAVIALLAVGIVLWILWSFVGSVMQFVLVDAVVTKDVRIHKPFRERFWLGVRLFAFQIGLLIAIITVIGLPVAAVYFGSVAVTPAIIPLVLLGLLLVFVVAVVMQLTTDFVVPTMIAEDRALLSSWGRVVPVFRAEFSEFGLYVIVRFILGILASIGIGIAALLALLVVAIPFAIVGGAAFLALNAANIALTSTVGLVVFGALGLLFVLAAIAVGAVVQMPVVTYFRYYSLFLLGSTDDSLDLVSQFRSDDDSSAPEGPTPA
ncbi:hypothetical protein [Haloferax sp. Q22]|uniref:DUF7544 domain-containing protein n=1 Tax=Haloferax sp. (strain Q22) TaxID=1526048 RepID=UPI000737C403|nr:hypothetical protein [Haloferax sp. Q22]